MTIAPFGKPEPFQQIRRFLDLNFRPSRFNLVPHIRYRTLLLRLVLRCVRSLSLVVDDCSLAIFILSLLFHPIDLLGPAVP